MYVTKGVTLKMDEKIREALAGLVSEAQVSWMIIYFHLPNQQRETPDRLYPSFQECVHHHEPHKSVGHQR